MTSNQLPSRKPFLLKAPSTRPMMNAAAVISTAVLEAINAHAVPVGEVPSINAGELAGPGHSPLAQAFLDLVKSNPLYEGMPNWREADILYCRWAPTHSDLLFSKQLFLSAVVHTGPSAYRLESFRTKAPEEHCPGGFGLDIQSVDLEVSDWFVMDPTIPHMTAPCAPHQDSILILLQWVIPRAQWAQKS